MVFDRLLLGLGGRALLVGCGGGAPTAVPATTVTVTVTSAVPGPTITETTQVPAPAETVTEQATPAPRRTTQPPTPAPEPPTSSGLSDGSFTGTTPRGLKSQFGTCQATARVTNTSSDEKSALVTYTLFRGDEQVGTLQGAANAVGAGETATVQLTSTESCPRGSLRYEFQVDAEF